MEVRVCRECKDGKVSLQFEDELSKEYWCDRCGMIYDEEGFERLEKR